MINNKKAIMRIMIFVIVFGVLILGLMFRLILVKETGDQYLVPTITNVATDILTLYGSNESVATVGVINNTYNQVAIIPYDSIFLIFWIFAIITTFVFAFKARQLSDFSAYGFLFIGSFIILMFIGFVEQITSWFLNNFYYVLFSDIQLSTPIMNWFFNNLPFISYLWAMICLAINRINIPIRKISGRAEE